MTGSWTSPSGSRWEPAPGPDTGTTLASDPTTPRYAAPVSGGPRRTEGRRRGPVLVALVALLSLGGLGAGAYAYERSTADETPAAAAREPGAAADGQGVPDGHRDGDHRRGDRDDASGDGQRPGSDGDR